MEFYTVLSTRRRPHGIFMNVFFVFSAIRSTRQFVLDPTLPLVFGILATRTFLGCNFWNRMCKTVRLKGVPRSPSLAVLFGQLHGICRQNDGDKLGYRTTRAQHSVCNLNGVDVWNCGSDLGQSVNEKKSYKYDFSVLTGDWSANVVFISLRYSKRRRGPRKRPI